MQDIIASYDEKCRKIIDNMDSVKQFKEDFQKRQNEINRFKARSFFFYKIKHPIKSIYCILSFLKIFFKLFKEDF